MPQMLAFYCWGYVLVTFSNYISYSPSDLSFHSFFGGWQTLAKGEDKKQHGSWPVGSKLHGPHGLPEPLNRCADSQHCSRGQEGHPVSLLMGRLLRNVPDARFEKFISYKRCLNTQRANHVKTQGEDGHLPAKGRGLRRNHPCQHLDHEHPAFRTVRNKVLFFKSPPPPPPKDV